MKLLNSKKNPRKMNFPTIYRPKLQKFSLYCLPWGHTTEPLNYANNKETESLWKYGCRQKCLDKSLDKGCEKMKIKCFTMAARIKMTKMQWYWLF